MKKIELSEQWLKESLTSKSPKEISEEIGCNVETVRRRIRDLGISRSRNSHLINEGFFDKWSHDMAYILGFTYADGSINTSLHHNQLTYQLNTVDLEVLEFIRDKIQPSKRIYKYERIDKRTKKVYQVSHLTISSKKIVKSLSGLGCIPNKTYEEIHIPDIPRDFWGDYLRGLFDGDGSIYLHRGKIACSIACNQLQFLEEIKNRLGFGYLEQSKTCAKISFWSKKDVLKLYDIMYNGNFCLNRKYEKFTLIDKE